MNINNKRWLELREVDVSGYQHEKQGMTYIPWGEMELLLRTHLTDEELVPFAWAVEDGSVVVTLDGVRYPLAISDFRNNAIESPDATDVNDTLQRAIVKAYARHYGLGHKLYEANTYKSVATAKTKSLHRKSQADHKQFF